MQKNEGSMQPRRLLPTVTPFSPDNFQSFVGPVNNQFVNGQFMGTMNGANPGMNNFGTRPIPGTNAMWPMPASFVNYSPQSGTMPTPASQNSPLNTFANANMNRTYEAHRSVNIYQHLASLQQENARLRAYRELVAQENTNLRANHQSLLRRTSAITQHYGTLRGPSDFEIQPDGRRLRRLVPGTIPRQTAVVEPGVPVRESQAQLQARVIAWAGRIVPNDPNVLLRNNGNTDRPLAAPVLRRPEYVDLTGDDDGPAQAPIPAYIPQPAGHDAALPLAHPTVPAASTLWPAQQANPGQQIAGQRRRRESESNSASVVTPLAHVPVVPANPEPSPPLSNDGDSMAPPAKRVKKMPHWMPLTNNDTINHTMGYDTSEENRRRHQLRKQAEFKKQREIVKVREEEAAAKKKAAAELKQKETARKKQEAAIRRQETARKRQEIIAREKEEAAERKDKEDALWVAGIQEFEEEEELNKAATMAEEDQDAEADDDEEGAGPNRDNVPLKVGDATVNMSDKDATADKDDCESIDSLFE
ncbi:hypothetical protein LTR99_003236 [Exophiala xenobiotica]|uniref:BZIP domain-containing protein n=1 Tax=Vermiconidia calcicola TaxID=1690605 RepID=A0AAV9QCZ1_9PEZI|nr:hypothetical protein LTR92_005978 [Exophiala xenobiotica]KAK5538902.1 hypothetical protein LTR25_004446 [Vermiconidia calcicola]KAK5540528.1 hypothetical protein LTR23_006210 [Chaetothyriales sp. CCFEE 6169]KAK5221740.1 hypothetical protein LTR72_005995 [Exophiala xenobiotica]KAK5268302.1 hypothetical protein LTR96_006849 [Exophiala xenobiotica]